jgi:hypothetical protein
VHWNAGFTHTPAAEVDGREYNLFTPRAALSGIWRVHPMLNLMLESVVEWERVGDVAAPRQTIFSVSPGFRTGFGAALPQTVLGVGIPITLSGGRSEAAVLGYVSYELAFRAPQP